MSEENTEDFKPKAKDALLRILRQKVSLKKKRYKKDGFDLDLTCKIYFSNRRYFTKLNCYRYTFRRKRGINKKSKRRS
jgi:hypothetical protein